MRSTNLAASNDKTSQGLRPEKRPAPKLSTVRRLKAYFGGFFANKPTELNLLMDSNDLLPVQRLPKLAENGPDYDSEKSQARKFLETTKKLYSETKSPLD